MKMLSNLSWHKSQDQDISLYYYYYFSISCISDIVNFIMENSHFPMLISFFIIPI